MAWQGLGDKIHRVNVSRRSFLLLSTAFWAAIAFLFAVQASARGAPGTFARMLATSFASFVPCMLLTPPIALVTTHFRFAPGTRGRSALAHAAALIAFLIGGGALMGVCEWLLPWDRSSSVTHAAAAAIPRYVAFDVLTYVLVAVAAIALVYAREALETRAMSQRLQGQLAEARLHVLTAQLQPHFLFNTLNAIAALVRDDPTLAERLLARLSELLRHSLRDGTDAETTLESELSFLEKYLEVQEARFGPRLAVTFQVDPRLLDAKVPRLILQPLVENAIRHGIAPRSGPGAIQVSASQDGDRVHLSVLDDGLGLAGKLSEGIGLRSTRERLRQLYGDDQHFTLARAPHGGTSCTLSLPLRRCGEQQGARAS